MADELVEIYRRWVELVRKEIVRKMKIECTEKEKEMFIRNICPNDINSDWKERWRMDEKCFPGGVLQMDYERCKACWEKYVEFTTYGC